LRKATIYKDIFLYFLINEMKHKDMLFPRSLATTGTCTYSRKSSGLYLPVVEPAMRIQNGLELPE
jgi:hypothetical protein